MYQIISRKIKTSIKFNYVNFLILRFSANGINFLFIIFSADNNFIYPAILSTKLNLEIPEFKISPTMREIAVSFDAVIHNVIETHLAITTWGKQAKTKERMMKKILVDEVRHERSWFKMISEDKDIMRYKDSFDGGVRQKDPDVRKWLEVKHECFSEF